MTRTGFALRNAFRNKRRSALTVLSLGFSMLLLTLLMAVWRGFYLDDGSAESAQRVMTRHRISLTFFLPTSYRERIRAVPGVTAVAPMTWFGGRYIDDRPEHFFAQFGTDPEEICQVYREWEIPPEQLAAWKRDRSGAIAERKLAEKHGWSVGDRIVLQRNIFPVDLELTIRGFYHSPDGFQAVLFDHAYVEEAVRWAKGQAGVFAILTRSPSAVPRVAREIDDTFHNAPQPTKTESEKAFQLGFIEMLGNVKAFILSIAGAVMFAVILVCANTMAMSIRERVREVATLKTIGFTRGQVLALFVGEAAFLSGLGGATGVGLAHWMLSMAARSPMADFLSNIRVSGSTAAIAVGVALGVGLLSSMVPAWRASGLPITAGLRHVG
ncbi:MAG: FtsX-like permease family protein [Acidobacteria bacterium]|nr:FtsX-like permease family protein [Acidobacteriota bacterium]